MSVIIYVGIGLSISIGIVWTASNWIRTHRTLRAYRDFQQRMADPKGYEEFWKRAREESAQ